MVPFGMLLRKAPSFRIFIRSEKEKPTDRFASFGASVVASPVFGRTRGGRRRSRPEASRRGGVDGRVPPARVRRSRLRGASYAETRPATPGRGERSAEADEAERRARRGRGGAFARRPPGRTARRSFKGRGPPKILSRGRTRLRFISASGPSPDRASIRVVATWRLSWSYGANREERQGRIGDPRRVRSGGKCR